MRMEHHGGDVTDPAEILFETEFDYLFPRLVREPSNLVAQTRKTVDALSTLGDAMADPGDADTPMDELNSTIPAVMTYLGQFMDHDLTARTDRDNDGFPSVSDPDLVPVSPDFVTTNLKNGRRPVFDLDSVYGDGPGLVPGGKTVAQTFQGVGIYRENLRLRLQRVGHRVDVPRETIRGTSPGRALIPDERNDENVIVSQIHAAFIALHNRIAGSIPGSDEVRYIRARQLVRWCYQYIVANEYLPTICQPAVVADVRANGPRWIGAAAGRGGLFMPLEFSVAGFRFAHSMIRPFYDLNANTRRNIDELFFPGDRSLHESDPLVVEHNGVFTLKRELNVDWDHFVPDGDAVQFARRIDPKLAKGLFNLTFGGNDNVMRNLARRNLLRGYMLSIPTGQAVAKALGVEPLRPEMIAPSTPSEAQLKAALAANEFIHRTPLWFYLLREAELQSGGNRLGQVGSRLVAETLWGLIAYDMGSFVNHRVDPAVKPNGIHLPNGRTIASISDLTSEAQVRD